MIENKKVSENSEDLKLIFSDLKQEEEHITCKLPSRGKLYTDGREEVNIRPITFDDEKILATTQIENPLNVILSRCCGGVNIDSLLLMDRTALFLKLREVSFGDAFEVRITCPTCGAISEVGLNISDFPIEELPEDFTEPREIYLEEIKRSIYTKAPRVRDEHYLDDINSIHKNLWRFITKIQITKERYTEDKTFISEVIEKLPRKDIHKLITNISLGDYGYQTKFMFKCAHCPAENLMEAPFSSDFFTEASS